MPQLCVMLAILIPIIVQTESYCFRGNYIGPFSVCTSCPGGWYQDEVNSYSCKGCGPGTYGYMSGRSSCFSCHTGKYKRETTYINTYYSSCKYCPTGYEAPQTKTIKCSQCVAGTYNDQIGLYTTSCKYCQAGYYNQLVGSRQSSACIQCSRGKYSDFIGASSCKPCVKGRFNTNMGSADAQSCLPCPAGKSSNIESLMTPNDCTDCAKGKYQTLEGSVECINCGAGRYGVISGGSVESICKDCSPGMQQPSVFSQQCYECPVGKYSSEMSTTLCTGCEKGLYSNKTRSTSCYECPKGRNLVDTSGEAHYHSSIKNCSFCPIGTYNPIPGLGTACFSCPGSNKVGTRSCNGCDPGKYKKGAQGCFLCDAGKHTDAMDLPNCRDCPTGWYASEARPYVRCLPCKRGFFGDIAGAINVNYGCKMCSRGRYSAAESLAAEVGKIPCTGCPLGRYSTEEGVDKESRCVYCQPGRYSSVLSLSTPTCVRCSEGKFSEKVGCTSNTCCKNCPVGFSQAFNASAFCIGCRAGTFNTEEGKSKCKECPRGKFKPALSDKSSLCNKCPAGYAQNFTSQAQCSACMPGMTAGVAGSQTCVKCEKGRYVGHKASKTPNCKLAPIGKYVSDGSTSTIPVPEGFRASSCVDENGAGCQASFVCVAGKFGALPPTGAPCNECPIGYFSSLGWVNCQKCAPGKFASKKSSTVCTSCPIGYVQLAENQPQCSKCELGKSTSMAGSKYCEILFNGTIAPPDLRSLRPVDRFSSGLILTVDSLIPESVVSILIQWSTSKKFRNTSGEMRELILSKHHVMSRPIVFNASRSGPVWRSPIYLRASWMLSSGRIGRFSEINGYSRVASDCRQQYLQTHPNDDLCSPPLDLLLKEDFHPQCKECPPGGSCNCNYEYPGAPGILVWNIAPLQGYWRVPWEPTNSTPLFYRCPRPDACLGVSLDDTFNATHGWPWPIENENIENSKSCPPNLVPSRCKKGTSGPLCSICEQGYNRVQGSCEKCIPATTRITYLILTLIIFCPLLIYAVRIIRKTRSEIRYALRDANRILLIFVSLSQINVTITEVVNIQWPQNVLKFLDQFSWANIDLVVITGATCEAGVDFRFTFVCMASIPVIIFSLAVAHYFRGTRIILQRIKSLRKGTEQQKRKEKLLCYVEIFCVVDADHSGKISASEFVDLLKLVGYDNKSGKLTTSIALRAIQRITGSTFATSLSMNRFVDGMEKGKIVEVADALLGARTRRRSSGSRLLDSVSEETGELVPRRKGSIFKRRETRNVFHKSDAFSLVLWNHHRKLVTSSFSWAMQFLMLMHTPISRKVFQYLDCAEIGRGDFIRSFVRADYSIPCRHLGGEFDLAYLSFLPLVIIVLCGFTILLPFGILAFLIYQRKHLYSPGVHAKIGWLYERMNRGAEFWEIFGK
jgi:hypothetical protein